MSLRRGFTIPAGANVVVVEDVITTGGSTREVIGIVQACGANVLGAGSIIDRSGGGADVGAPRVALETLQVLAYEPDSCPMCAAGSVAEKPGSRPV
ncbi:MAG TPA: phosphoribosyltransferase family protein [Bryobacteraceae bacterium]|nr:phosphoribosyltransferase family protein [Bryobacteraceae bacterium]